VIRRHRLLAPGLIGIGALLLAPGWARGQTSYEVLHAFTRPGMNPDRGPLVQATDGRFYGTTTSGGVFGGGTAFRMEAAGAVTTLHDFDCGASRPCMPSGLIQASDGFLYGVTQLGGVAGQGTLYRMSMSGVVTVLHSFDCFNGEGCQPRAPLLQAADGLLYGTAGNVNFKVSTAGVFTSLHTQACSPYPACGEASALIQATDGFLYGTTSGNGATSNGGTVFKVNTAGTVTTLLSLSCGGLGFDPCLAGEGVTQRSDGFFYGVTSNGGDSRSGVAFRLSAAGAFTVLHSFACSVSEGCHPTTAPVRGSDGFLYGTTREGGPGNGGAIYRIDTAGNVSTFFPTTPSPSFDCGPGGCVPGRLMQASDGRFYGTTALGAAGNGGTSFRITTTGVFATLHEFGATAEGWDPRAGLVQASDGKLYGTTALGGSEGCGTLFSIDRAGVTTTLHSFVRGTDGCEPQGNLIQASDGALYGTTPSGGTGADQAGTVFRWKAGQLEVLHSFACAVDGCPASSGVIQASDGNLYGTTAGGGASNGTAFKMTPVPAGSFTVLHDFNCGIDGGCAPQVGLVEATVTDGRLYGGASSLVFRIDAAGGFTPLHVFSCSTEGCGPSGRLLQASDGRFFGVAMSGGAHDQGTAFVLDASRGVAVLHAFDCLGPEGCRPGAGLIQASDHFLYGTAQLGGAHGEGTVFRMDGTFLASAHSFACATEGCHPALGELVQASDGDIYGTAESGPGGGGVVFRLAGPNPAEASPTGDMRLFPGPGTSLQVSYTPACGAMDHAIYWGVGPPVGGTPRWTSVACGLGTSGSAVFDPGTPPVGKLFSFVVVGQTTVEEGSYGHDSAGVERPEAQGFGVCDRPRILNVTCP